MIDTGQHAARADRPTRSAAELDQIHTRHRQRLDALRAELALDPELLTRKQERTA